jgi:TolA-binding protein
MSRGIFGSKVNIIFGLLLCGLSSFSIAANKSAQPETAKIAAPNKETGQAYLSEKQTAVPPEAAKQADVLRLKTIASIKTILDSKKNNRQEFELLLRMGELYMERAEYLRDLEEERHAKAHERWEKEDIKTRAAKPPVPSFKESDSSLYNAAQSFRKLASKFPTHPRTDTVFYSLGNTLSRLNDDNAVTYYKQLIKNHPKSPLLPDAWLATGEFYFDKHDIKNARDAYQKMMAFKNHRAYPYAVYKLGWCFYNSQGDNEKTPGENLKKSITAFQLVVKLSEKNKSQKFNLRDEALRDLVMAFAEAEDTEGAWSYFKEIGEQDRFYSTLERMGSLYADAGKNAKAIEVYTRLVSESPNRKTNPNIYQKLLSLHDQTQKFRNVVATITTMTSTFASDSKWLSANKSDKKTIESARSIVEKSMHRYGTLFHSRGQKIKNQELENLAAEIYAMYLDTFPKEEAAYEIRFYLADIQYSQKKYAQASTNFLKVAQQRPKDGKHLKPAAYNAVEALATLVAATKFDPTPPPAQATKELDIPRMKKLYADTIDFYTNTLPTEAAGLPMRYTAAQIYFDYGHYGEAIKRFDKLATEHGQTKQGQQGARTVIAYFNEKSDWIKAIEFGKRYQLNNGVMADANIKKFIDTSLRQALFNRAVAAEKNKDYVKAAASFLEFQKIFPHDPNADRALFNASLNQFNAGQIEESIATKKRILATYSKSALAADVTASLAETYEATAQFLLAAETYRKFSDYFPKDQRAPLSLYNAAVLYRGVQRMDLAAKSFSDIYVNYPAHPTASDAILESAKIKESNNDILGAISSYNILAASPGARGSDDAFFAEAKSIELRLVMDRKNESARKSLSRLVQSLRSQTPPKAFTARTVTARLLFDEQEASAKNFKAIVFTDGKDVTKQAALRQGKLEVLAKTYEDIIQLGSGEYTVASYYRLGELHEDFANALLNAPAPTNSSEKEVAEFKSQIEQAALPLKDESTKFFETALRLSTEVETFSPWTRTAYQKMSQIAPDRYPLIREYSASPGYTSIKVSLSPATKEIVE